MIILNARNAPTALAQGLLCLARCGVPEKSRAGDVLVAPTPVTTMTMRPLERVLTSPIRDANPFFHAWEAVWMLTGRDDAAMLNCYVRDFGERFAEKDGRVHGAYGHRWRKSLGLDQLDHVVATLRGDPTSRQCVLQMWDGMADTAYACNDGRERHCGSDDLRGSWRDRPCNTHAYLRVRRELESAHHNSTTADPSYRSVLDLTVCCRSNDAIWGAHGANAVHFSVLLEYLAARVGVGVGRMYQVSNNYHVYESEISRMYARTGLASETTPRLRLERLASSLIDQDQYCDDSEISPRPMFQVPDAIDEELGRLAAWHDECVGDNNYHDSRLASLRNPALRDFALMAVAHWHHRSGRPYEAANTATIIGAPDWRRACCEWLARRRKP